MTMYLRIMAVTVLFTLIQVKGQLKTTAGLQDILIGPVFKTAQVQVPAVAPTPSVIDIIQASLGVSPEDAAVIADSLLPVISYDGAPGMIGTQQVLQKQVVDSMPARSTADQVLGTIQEQPAAAVPVIDPVPIDPVEAARTEAAPVVAETQAPTTVSPADIIPVSGPVQAETPTLVVSGIRTALNSATQLLQPSALTVGLSLLAQPAVEQPEALAPAPGVPAVITTQSPRVTNPRLISQTSCPGVLVLDGYECKRVGRQECPPYTRYDLAHCVCNFAAIVDPVTCTSATLIFPYKMTMPVPTSHATTPSSAPAAAIAP